MEDLITLQEEISDQIKRAFTNYKKTNKEKLTPSYIQIKLEDLETLWRKFTDNHYSVVIAVPRSKRENVPYFAEDWFGYAEEVYTDCKIRILSDLKKGKVVSTKEYGSSSDNAPNVPSHVDVKLPQIQLPTFGGNYEEWQSFHDMFNSLIHKNTSLSQVQKLHYLKSSLKGEPENLLKGFDTTDTNYDEAWGKLVRRYSNKRYNANEILKRLFAQKSLTSESAPAIKEMLDITSACLKSLMNLGIDTKSWDVIICHLIVSKLDYESRKQWEMEVSRETSDSFPTWDQLVRFLETRFRTLEMLSGTRQVVKSTPNMNTKQQFTKQKTFHSTVLEDKKESHKVCVFCSSHHLLYQCKQFGAKSPEERSEFIQTKGLCFNCFSSSHNVKACHQSTCCRRCGRRHHTLLHIERRPQPEPTEAPTVISGPESSPTRGHHKSEYEKKVVAHFAKQEHQGKMLLATALVKAKSTNGYSQTVRILIDQGSEASFVTESVVQSLYLNRVPVNGIVTGVGDGSVRTKNIVKFDIESLHNPGFSISINAFVLTSLTSLLPSRKASITSWPDLSRLPLADPQYDVPGKIDVILGVEAYSQILLDGLLKHPLHGSPVAQNTQLGWILSGRVSQTDESSQRVVNFHLQIKEDSLLKQFWEIEREPDLIKKKLTKEEVRCEEIYESTTTRNSEGRYVVKLPFRESNPKCVHGKSKEIAMRRFNYLERKLKKNPMLRVEYAKVLSDYLEQKHMEEITDQLKVEDPYAVYLPHHAVIREDKQTTKVRIVFDASCKGVNHVSLNDTLMVGPKLQQDLRHILMRWRTHPFCIIADIVQMYRQVVVNDSDVDFQRIVWRPNPDQPIQYFKLLRLTFGTSCAPYLAVKTIQRLAKDEQLQHPLAAKITLEDFYMDDLLTGCETEKEAIEIYMDMERLMCKAGFQLQKWCSNSPILLDHIEGHHQNSDETFMFKINDTIKVLGIAWNKTTDRFEYTFNLPDVDEPISKRKVLSDIARLYDPMGWVAPVLITAKIFMQKLWKSGLNWDDNLTPDLLNQWIQFREELNNIKRINLPRWLSMKRDNPIELHVFADASQAAYAAVVYLKSTDEMGITHVNIVTAKTKVAPVEKEISIPRMELCAALLAAKLIFEVAQILHVPKERLVAWTDSMVVLAWLRGEPSRWTTFVSNRVSEILTILDNSQWNHVSTDNNPADCASRGISVSQLLEYKLWWHGPKMIHQSHTTLTDLEFDTDLEERPIRALTTSVQPKEEFIWTQFSNLTKMLRVLSYCRKFLQLKNLETKNKINKLITVEEMNTILKTCIKATQEFYFLEEIHDLQSVNKCVKKRSQLLTLSPYLDDDGLLRVGGRIDQAAVQLDKKHPYILPSDSHLSKLIIWDAHYRTLHGGPQIMLNYLRSKYWIIKAREKVKKIYRECVTCVRYSRQNNNQFMGDLPKVRLTPDKPFRSSGVDFTGHINVRFSPGRGSRAYKGYICVFVCMATKAVHLEAVSDLTATGFIAAFKRFVSRRGKCQHLYSDNGTNFVGADKELKDMFNRAKSQLPVDIAHLLTEEGTTWHFIPPHAPNFGGLWESAVRCSKMHLKRVIGDTTLTFEELTTVLTQVEACLNSRPVSFLSDNLEDPMPLTPGHFLVGEPLVTIPDENFSDTCPIGLQRWKLTQKMLNDFWRKWSNEYLVTLNQRYKWCTKKNEPEINDVVVVRDHNVPPAKWLLGKIIEKHPGKDNLTRVVTVKTKNGTLKRPCNKLCYLPKA